MDKQIDTEIIDKLAEVLNKNNLMELEYEAEKLRIRIKKAGGAPMPVQPMAPAAPVAVENKRSEYSIDDYSDNVGTVKSPIVGVVYLSPDPTKPDYVSVGDKVKEGDIVCLIEAMKTFNPVKAHRSGVVAKILVESGDPVEYGESLLIIE
ncbi:MAG: acetyl-CoA carboxylase biotin carboxyl carrier protein [Alphaproteobacteria bacterium]|nr:acetyl-CoA carboxylase biotin carboxyl carrier protein [Alphaproteobacteria bacterium]